MHGRPSPTESLLDSDVVAFEPPRPAPTDSVTVIYRGFLARSPGTVYARVGHGKPDKWMDIREYPMVGRGPMRKLSYHLQGRPAPLNVCFRDEGGNWDNNGGLDWQLEY